MATAYALHITLTLLLVDIDQFKVYNDTYGHQAGDHCLKQVAQSLADCVHRATDLVARFGGEEFVIILANTNEEGAKVVTEKMHLAVAELGIENKNATIPRITISIGLISITPMPNLDADLAISLADKALYTAKEQGRDQTIFEYLEEP